MHVANFEGGCSDAAALFLGSAGFSLRLRVNTAWVLVLGLDATTFFSVGARHAVPGERTWRGGAIHRVVEFRGNGETISAGVALDGAGLLVARSGTACRAPTETKRTKSRFVLVWRDCAEGYVGAG